MATILVPQDNTNMVQAQWQEMFGAIIGNGVVQGQLNSYVVTTTSGLGISVASGKAMIQGFLARSDAAVPLTCAAADPTNPRIDRAVLHADLSAHTLTVQMLTGTPAPSPAAPALTQTATVWEISLYQVRVNATQTTLTGGSLTDERIYSGYLPLTGGALTGGLTGTTLGLSGALTQLNGQASAGSFGAPVIVAQALDVAVTVTTAQTILFYTPTTTGYYRISAYLAVKGSGSPVVALSVGYNDPLLGPGQIVYPIGVAAGVVKMLNGVVTSDANQAPAPVIVKTAGGSAITVVYQNTVATPNDLVTVFIERMS